MLALPNFNLSFMLATDASGDSLGTVLGETVDGAVAYASRVLSRTEMKCNEVENVGFSVGCLHSPYNGCICNFKEPESQLAYWLEVLSGQCYTSQR